MNGRLIRAVGTVGGLTAMSRLLGMTRDILMAAFFGTSHVMSAFVLAFTIPNLFRRLFGEGALSSAFIPVFVETRSREGDQAAWTLGARISSLLLAVLTGLTLLGWALLALLSVYLSGPMAELTLDLLQIMLPYMIFICLAALAMSMLNAYRHFTVPAFAPCLLNVVWIVFLWGSWQFFPEAGEEARVTGLAWGILLAGALQLLIQVPVLRRFGYRLSWNWAPRAPRVRRVLLLMGPAALGMAITQVNVMVDRLLAAAIGPHAPAALFFSERLIYLPLGLFATAMGTVLLPTLSEQVAAGKSERRLDTVHQSIRLLSFLMIPAAFGLYALADPIVRMLLAAGRFDADSIFYTSVALRFYAPGLFVFSLAKIVVPVFYSAQDMRTPVRVGVMAVGFNLVLNLIFFWTWPQPIRHAGLALATVISEALYVVVLAWIFHRRYGSPQWMRMGSAVLRFCLLAVGMAWVSVWVESLCFAYLADLWIPKLARIASVLLTIGLSGTVYVLGAWLLRFPEMGWIQEAWRQRRQGAGPVSGAE